MDKSKKLMSFSRVIVMITVALLLSTAIHAQEEFDFAPRRPKATPILELKLNTVTTAICADSLIELEMEVTNISQDELEIDHANLWENFVYSIHEKEERRVGSLSLASNTKDMSVLYPGQIYRAAFTFTLENEFFDEAGTYSFLVQYKAVRSNVIKFEVFECGIKKIEGH